MDQDTTELYQVNDDLIFILDTGLKIGWDNIKPQSLNRIIYLAKVLFSFVNEDDSNIMDYYHFTAQNMTGPMSSIINNSIAYLESQELILTTESGVKLNTSLDSRINNILDTTSLPVKLHKQSWLKTVMLILGKFGENRVFSFTINDPLYIENIESNNPKEINFENSENKTLTILNSFKDAFEESLEDTSNISKQEYLELYFDYIFSQIIK